MNEIKSQNDKLIIAIDCMGGDHAPDVPVQAVLNFLNEKHHSNVKFHLYGNEKQINAILSSSTHPSISVIHTNQIITGEDKTRDAVRKKESSMYQVLLAVKNNKAHLAVSGGNTAALFSLSYLLLGCLQGVLRPALSTKIITEENTVQLLDLGANINSSYKNLIQYALMGLICVRSIDQVQIPKVGLLNIGEEEQKGLESINMAAEELKKLQETFQFQYMGFIEPNLLFKGNLDVLVFDGFVGNVLLKTLEGTIGFLQRGITTQIKSHKFLSLLAGPLLWKIKKNLQGKWDPRNYNGAFLLGLSKTVVKSHGSSDVKGFLSAINVAYTSEKSHMIPLLSNTFQMLGYNNNE